MSQLSTSLPKIVVELPGPKSQAIMDIRAKNVPGGVSSGSIPTVAARASGAMIEDVDGNIIMDFGGGIGVMNIGHANPEITAVITEQAGKFLHTSINVVHYESYIKLAEKLNSIIPGDFPKKTMFVNSGAEAVENALKVAKKYTNRQEIVTFTGAFHGRTHMTMALTSKVKPYKFGFGPFPGNVHRAEFPYVYRRPEGITEENAMDYYKMKLDNFFMEEVDPDEVACVIIEPLQGEGGFVPAPIEYVKYLRQLCDKHGMLLICDEIQTGYCRTGRMFASEYWAEAGVYADITTTAKSISAGLPLSTVTGRAEIMDAAQAGGIGGTFCGNPVATAVGMKVIEIMQRDDYAAKARNINAITMKRLNEMMGKYDIIGDVRAMGAMMAFELVKDRVTKAPAKDELKAVIKECNRNGLVVLDSGVRGNNVRFLMPLCITDEQLLCGLDIIENAIRSTIGLGEMEQVG